MKQELLCNNCSEELKNIIGKGSPGEYSTFTPGRALNEYRCDYCGNLIDPLQQCVAFSLWTDTIPLIPGWEKNYIITGGQP